jgi:hypothetical protein
MLRVRQRRLAARPQHPLITLSNLPASLLATSICGAIAAAFCCLIRLAVDVLQRLVLSRVLALLPDPAFAAALSVTMALGTPVRSTGACITPWRSWTWTRNRSLASRSTCAKTARSEQSSGNAEKLCLHSQASAAAHGRLLVWKLLEVLADLAQIASTWPILW